MSEVIDQNLLKELCRKYQVPPKLAQKIISEFSTVEMPKKNYIQEIIEEWNNSVDKKGSS